MRTSIVFTGRTTVSPDTVSGRAMVPTCPAFTTSLWVIKQFRRRFGLIFRSFRFVDAIPASTNSPIINLTGLLVLVLLCSAAQAQSSNPTSAQGQELFDGSCARCHGFDAAGAIGPNLQRSALLKAEAESAFKVIVQTGIPARGMPATPLSDAEMSAIGHYIRSMRVVEPSLQAAAVARGREVYRQQDCGSCHIVQGVGKGYGPELTDVGVRRKADQLRRDLTEPSAALPQVGGVMSYLPLKVTTLKGQVISGLRLNEDAFTLQLRDNDGHVKSFKKAELTQIEKQFDRSSMPRVIVEGAPLDDLVVYLSSLRGVK